MELLKKLPSPVGLSHDEIMDILFREGVKRLRCVC